MFQWDKSIDTLDLPVDQIVHLFRSMRDVQLALPGLPAQEATAYLCQYQSSQGIGTVAVFHLHKSGQMAFYVNTPREIAIDKTEAMLDQATIFVESMGFLMTDLDIHLLNESDRAMLWSSLPLRNGIETLEKSLPERFPVVRRETPVPPARQTNGKLEKTGIAAVLQDVAQLSEESEFLRETLPVKQTPTVEVRPEQPSAETTGDAGTQRGVDDLLAAVEALRTRRPGVRARKKAPSPDELRRRRLELRENLGRILASL